jgi:YqaJ-like viral recombinase domain
VDDPRFIDCVQGSKAWLECRLGCVTSSRVAAAISFLKRQSKNGGPGDETAARRNLRFELVSELETGVASEHYVSRWMEEGKEKEPLARAAYEIAKDVNCDQIGFAFHASIKMAGASPDSLVGNDGLAEYKCPRTSTHIGYILGGVVPVEYRPQMYWQIACLEREWCDFVSYDPSIKKAANRIFIRRLFRDDAIIKEMEKQVEIFNAEVQEMQEMIAKLDEGYIERQLKRSLEAV